jgi:hypothetical protein
MHINAVGTSIDLRGSQLDQINKRYLEPASMKVFLKAKHRFVYTKPNLQIVDSRLPSSSSIFVCSFG